MTVVWSYVIAFLIYFVLIWFVAYKVAARVRSWFEYSVGGRTVAYLSYAFLISATFISAVSVFGGTGIAYALGYVSVVAWAIPWMLALCLAYLIAWKLRRPASPPTTLPEAMKIRFDMGSTRSIIQFLVAFWGLLFCLVFNTAQVKGFGIVMSHVTGLDFSIAILFYVILLVFITLGGYLAVLRTNIVHQFVITAGLWGALLSVLFLPQIGGLSGLHEKAAAIATVPVRDGGPIFGIPTPEGALLTAFGVLPVALVATIILSNLLASTAPFWPTILLASRRMKDLFYGGAIASLIIGFTWVTIPLLGLSARVLMPADSPLSDQDFALPWLIAEHLPEHVGILAMLGTFAAAMSSSTALLFYAAIFLINDMVGVVRPKLTPESMFRYSRYSLFILGLITLLFTWIAPPRAILDLAALTFGMSAAAVAVPLFLGFYWSRMNKGAALLCLIVSPLMYLALIIFSAVSGVIIYRVLAIWVSLLVSLIIAVTASLVGKPSPKEGWDFFTRWA